jgi:iron complex transport system ATP-binding protein
MSGAAAPVLEVSDLSVALGGRDVIQALSCTLEAGAVVGLIGPNGSGKSTLLKAVLNLLPYRGSIRFAGTELDGMAAKVRARRLAYLPQDGELIWPIAVEDVVMLGRAPYRSGLAPPSDEDAAAVEAALRAMDLMAVRKRSARMLSGGERSRVLMARALAQQTPLLLADEPTTGLDPAHQIGLMETFRGMAREGKTVLASLHDLALAAQWCDRLLLLHEGRIVSAGAAQEVLTPSALKQVYGVEAFFGESPAGRIVVPIARA